MVEVDRRCEVLSTQEQRIWDDIQRFWAETADEPAAVRRAAAALRKQMRRERGELPAWVGIATWVAIFTVLFGAVATGLALGAATFVGWGLWRYWPQLAGRAAAAPTPTATLRNSRPSRISEDCR